MSKQWHFDPGSYLEMVRSEIPRYDDLQKVVAEATPSVSATTILDLGSGTGVTAQAVLARHAGASLVGIDASDTMLRHARELLPNATFFEQRLQDPLPPGPFDLVVSAFAIHHLDGSEKALLFERVAQVMARGGRFVLSDVVIPTAPVGSPVPLEEGVDKPSTVAEQIAWLEDAGLNPHVILAEDDLGVIAADRA